MSSEKNLGGGSSESNHAMMSGEPMIIEPEYQSDIDEYIKM